MYDYTHAVSDCTHGRLCVAEPEKLRSRVRLRLFCDLYAFAVKCTQVRSRNKEPVVRVLLCGCVGR